MLRIILVRGQIDIQRPRPKSIDGGQEINLINIRKSFYIWNGYLKFNNLVRDITIGILGHNKKMVGAISVRWIIGEAGRAGILVLQWISSGGRFNGPWHRRFKTVNDNRIFLKHDVCYLRY